MKKIVGIMFGIMLAMLLVSAFVSADTGEDDHGLSEEEGQDSSYLIIAMFMPGLVLAIMVLMVLRKRKMKEKGLKK